MDLSIDQPIGDLSILLADVDYKKENELLKLELSQTRENADRLKEQLTKKLQMESKIQEAVVKADKSIRQNTELRQQVQTLQTENANLKQQTTIHKQEQEKLKKQFNEKQTEITQLKQKSEQSSKLESLQKEKNELIKEKEKLMREKTQTQQTHTSDIQKLTKEKETLETNTKKFQDHILKLGAELKQSKLEKESFSNQCKELESKCAQMDTILKQSDAFKDQEQIKELKNQILKHDKQLEEMQRKLESEKKQKQDAVNEYRSKSLEANEFQKQRELLNSKNKECLSKISTLEQEKENLNEMVHHSSVKIIDLEKKLEDAINQSKQTQTPTTNLLSLSQQSFSSLSQQTHTSPTSTTKSSKPKSQSLPTPTSPTPTPTISTQSQQIQTQSKKRKVDLIIDEEEEEIKELTKKMKKTKKELEEMEISMNATSPNSANEKKKSNRNELGVEFLRSEFIANLHEKQEILKRTIDHVYQMSNMSKQDILKILCSESTQDSFSTALHDEFSRDSKFARRITKQIIKVVQSTSKSQSEIKQSKFSFLFSNSDEKIWSLLRDSFLDILINRRERKSEVLLCKLFANLCKAKENVLELKYFIIHLLRFPPIDLTWIVSICSVWPQVLTENEQDSHFVLTLQTILLAPYEGWPPQAQPEDEANQLTGMMEACKWSRQFENIPSLSLHLYDKISGSIRQGVSYLDELTSLELCIVCGGLQVVFQILTNRIVELLNEKKETPEIRIEMVKIFALCFKKYLKLKLKNGSLLNDAKFGILKESIAPLFQYWAEESKQLSEIAKCFSDLCKRINAIGN